jgi:integrase
LRREVVEPWSGRSVHEIRKRDVVELVTGIVQRGAPATANKTFKAVRALFNWCVGRALLERSPCEALRLPARDVARERVLSDEELAAVPDLLRICGERSMRQCASRTERG